jgi:hypothetical protein
MCSQDTHLLAAGAVTHHQYHQALRCRQLRSHQTRSLPLRQTAPRAPTPGPWSPAPRAAPRPRCQPPCPRRLQHQPQSQMLPSSHLMTSLRRTQAAQQQQHVSLQLLSAAQRQQPARISQHRQQSLQQLHREVHRWRQHSRRRCLHRSRLPWTMLTTMMMIWRTLRRLPTTTTMMSTKTGATRAPKISLRALAHPRPEASLAADGNA